MCRTLLLALVILSTAGCGRADTDADIEPVEQVDVAHEAAIDLLSQLPANDVLTGDDTLSFIADANDVVAYLDYPRVQAVDDAISTLERIAALAGPVVAEVQTDPAGATVWYRRVYQRRNNSHPMITTDDSVSLSIPAEYYFWTVRPRSNDTLEYRSDCRRGCRVFFDLRN